MRNKWLTAVLILCVGSFGACSKKEKLIGEAGDPADVDQTVEISTSDELRFDPDAIDVQVGDTVELEITNEAQGEHEFVLGPMHEHGAGMQHNDPSATGAIPPGESATVVWTFTEAGEVTFACYIAGHNEAGMTGTITVAE